MRKVTHYKVSLNKLQKILDLVYPPGMTLIRDCAERYSDRTALACEVLRTAQVRPVWIDGAYGLTTVRVFRTPSGRIAATVYD